MILHTVGNLSLSTAFQVIKPRFGVVKKCAFTLRACFTLPLGKKPRIVTVVGSAGIKKTISSMLKKE